MGLNILYLKIILKNIIKLLIWDEKESKNSEDSRPITNVK